MTIASWILAAYLGVMCISWPLSMLAGILFGYFDDSSDSSKGAQ